MKGELEGSFYVALEGAPTTFFQGALKTARKDEENNTFDLVTHGLLESNLRMHLTIYMKIHKELP